jgi:hypothetical protein
VKKTPVKTVVKPKEEKVEVTGEQDEVVPSVGAPEEAPVHDASAAEVPEPASEPPEPVSHEGVEIEHHEASLDEPHHDEPPEELHEELHEELDNEEVHGEEIHVTEDHEETVDEDHDVEPVAHEAEEAGEVVPEPSIDVEETAEVAEEEQEEEIDSEHINHPKTDSELEDMVNLLESTSFSHPAVPTVSHVPDEVHDIPDETNNDV